MSRVVKIADVDIELRADGDDLRGPLDELFAGCPTGDAARVRVTVSRHGDQIVPPSTPPSATTPEASYWFLESGVVARHVSGVCGRRVGDLVEVGGANGGSDVHTALRLAVQMPLSDALGRHDCQVVHAAAVERGGFGVLVTGMSGAGKSTFAYAAGAAGWTILTDDLTIVRGVDPPIAWGFPKPLHVPDDIVAVPPDGASAIPADERRRWSLRPPVAESSSGIELRTVVAVGRSDDVAATAGGAMGVPWVKELLFSFPLVRIPDRLKSMFPTAAALSRLPHVRYLHDRDPDRRVAAVIEFLDDLDAPRDAPSDTLPTEL